MGGCFVKCGGILWRVFSFVILWSIWREMKGRIFRGTSISLADLISKVALTIVKWALIRKELPNLTLNDILFD